MSVARPSGVEFAVRRSDAPPRIGGGYRQLGEDGLGAPIPGFESRATRIEQKARIVRHERFHASLPHRVGASARFLDRFRSVARPHREPKLLAILAIRERDYRLAEGMERSLRREPEYDA